VAKKSETEAKLTTASRLLGASAGRLNIMISRERVSLADVRAIINDLHVASLTLVDLVHALESQTRTVQTVPAE